MNILVLDEWLPSICNSGKSIRSFRLLAPLARKHRITYLAHVDGDVARRAVRDMEDAGFEVVCVPRRTPYASAAAVVAGAIPALLDPLPISVRRHTSRRYADTLRQLVADRSFDLAHFEWTHYLTYEEVVRNLPRFACTHNVEFLSWRRFTKATRHPVKKLLGMHEAAKMFRFEKDRYRRLDYLSVVSEDDARLVREEFGIDRVGVIPNGVGIARYDEIPNTPRHARLVYCGSMDAFINQDAVAWFLDAIFPGIRARCPEATFCVIGRDPPEWLRSRADDRVTFTGAIDDIRLPLKEGMLEVVPLRIAGGSRLKILEAFAARIPVLSTTIGAEGLNVENGRNIVLADSPEAFVRRCVELLGDEAARSRLVEEGRCLVEREYDWSRISPMVEEAWFRTLEIHRDRS